MQRMTIPGRDWGPGVLVLGLLVFSFIVQLQTHDGLFQCSSHSTKSARICYSVRWLSLCHLLLPFLDNSCCLSGYRRSAQFAFWSKYGMSEPKEWDMIRISICSSHPPSFPCSPMKGTGSLELPSHPHRWSRRQSRTEPLHGRQPPRIKPGAGRGAERGPTARGRSRRSRRRPGSRSRLRDSLR
jgi:hypothetical protein